MAEMSFHVRDFPLKRQDVIWWCPLGDIAAFVKRITVLYLPTVWTGAKPDIDRQEAPTKYLQQWYPQQIPTAIVQTPLHPQHRLSTGILWVSKSVKSMVMLTSHGQMVNGEISNFERKNHSKSTDSHHVLIMDRYSHVGVVRCSDCIAMFWRT